MSDYIRDLRRAKWGAATNPRRKNLELPMSALGQNRTSKRVEGMSALPPKADHWDDGAIAASALGKQQ